MRVHLCKLGKRGPECCIVALVREKEILTKQHLTSTDHLHVQDWSISRYWYLEWSEADTIDEGLASRGVLSSV